MYRMPKKLLTVQNFFRKVTDSFVDQLKKNYGAERASINPMQHGTTSE